MMDTVRRRKPERTFLQIQVIFNLLHHIDVVWEEMAFDYAISYTQLNVMAVIGFISLSSGSLTQGLNQLTYLRTQSMLCVNSSYIVHQKLPQYFDGSNAR